jgi:hypothetical protein
MTRTTFTRIAGTTLATGFAALTFAAPASALEAPDPDTGGLVPIPSAPTTTSSDSNWLELGIGAVGGLAIAGAGVAAAAGIRHRHVVPSS